MNVKHLRELMKDLPDDAPVLVWDCYHDSGFREACEVELKAIFSSEEDEYQTVYSSERETSTPIPVLAIS